MKTRTIWRLVADHMGAVAPPPCGRRGRREAFIEECDPLPRGVEAGPPVLHAVHLRLSHTGRPAIWMHLRPDATHVPRGGPAARSNDLAFAVPRRHR